VPWTDYDLRPWEYVLVRNARPDAPRDAPAVLLLLASRGGMHLYRNGESTTTGPPSGAR
jgi:hypothetical protein